MENQRIIEPDETQVRELHPVPVIHTSYWTFTMEACLLTGKLGRAVRSVFAAFPEVIQHALTFTPESTGWVERAKLWQTVLKRALPSKQYHAAIQKFLAHYAKVVRKRRDKLCQYCLPSEKDVMREVGQVLCDCHRAGIAGESRPFEGDFETELEAFSRSSGVSVERLRANRYMETMYKLANEAYDIGAIERARKAPYCS